MAEGQQSSTDISEIIVSAGGVTGTAVVYAGQEFSIYLTGVETAATIGQGGTAYVWDLKNDQMQYMENGPYYVMVEQQDAYGHITSYLRDISVMRAEEYTELRIYNSSGEVLVVMKNYGSLSGETVILEAPDIAVINKAGGTMINIKYGNGGGESFNWDGTNSAGKLLSNGSYEMQVASVDGSGSITTISKTIVVLNERGAGFISGFVSYPSPYEGNTPYITFQWQGAGTGRAVIRIYNMTGELVRVLRCGFEDMQVHWDAKTADGQAASRGIYIGVIEAMDDDGRIERLSVKFAIMKPKPVN